MSGCAPKRLVQELFSGIVFPSLPHPGDTGKGNAMGVAFCKKLIGVFRTVEIQNGDFVVEHFSDKDVVLVFPHNGVRVVKDNRTTLANGLDPFLEAPLVRFRELVGVEVVFALVVDEEIISRADNERRFHLLELVQDMRLS